MLVRIEIIIINGYYHILDALVRIGDTVEIFTNIPNVNFKVVVANNDGFFANAGAVINGTVNSTTPLPLGTVTALGRSTKYYTIDNVGGVIPPITAPPRIIRVA
jgi:hypothetical protein